MRAVASSAFYRTGVATPSAAGGRGSAAQNRARRQARVVAEATSSSSSSDGKCVLGRRRAMLLKHSFAVVALDQTLAGGSRSFASPSPQHTSASSSSTASEAKAGSSSSSTAAVGFLDTLISEGEDRVTLAVWFPAANSRASSAETSRSKPYSYNISIQKLFKYVKPARSLSSLYTCLAVAMFLTAVYRTMVKWDIPGWFDRTYQFEARFPLNPATSWEDVRESIAGDGAPVENFPLLVIAHGFLGTRLDFVDLAEKLAAQGFVVAAPEFSDGLSAARYVLLRQIN